MMKEQTPEDASSKDTSKLAESSHTNGKKTTVELGLDNAAYEEDRTAMNDIPPVTDNKNGVELVNMNVQPGKTNGSEFTHYYLPVNTHKKLLRGEKLYVTRDPRARGVSRRKVLICAIIWFLIVVVFILAVLAAMGIIFTSPKSSTETDQEISKSTLLTVGTDLPTVVVNPEDSTFNGISSPQTLRLQFTITNLLFDHNLHNENSLHFQSLQRRLENELYQLFLPNLWKVVINQFSEGSVIVQGLLYSSADQQSVTDQEMTDHFTEALKKSDSYLGPYTISLSSISISDITEPQTKESRPSEFGRGMSGDWSTVTEFTTTTDLWSILAGWTTGKILTTQEEISLSTLHLHQFETETTTIPHETIPNVDIESETTIGTPETTTEAEYTSETTTETGFTSESTSETGFITETTSETGHQPEVFMTFHEPEVTTIETINATITKAEELETNVSTIEIYDANDTTTEDQFIANFTVSSPIETTESFVLFESTVSQENATENRVNITSTEFIIPPLFTIQEVTNTTNQTETNTDFIFPFVFTSENIANATNTTDDTTDSDFPLSFFTTKKSQTDNTTDDSFVSSFVSTSEIINATNGPDNTTEFNTTDDSFISPLVNASEVIITTKESENSTDFVFPLFVTTEESLNETSNDTSTTFNELTSVLVNTTIHKNVTTDFISSSEETHLEGNLNSTLNSTEFYESSTATNDIINTTEESTTLNEFATDNNTTSDNSTLVPKTSSDADIQTPVSNETSTSVSPNLGVTEPSMSEDIITSTTPESNATETTGHQSTEEPITNSDVQNSSSNPMATNSTSIEADISTTPTNINPTSSPNSEIDYANKNNEETSTNNETDFELTTPKEIGETFQNPNGEINYANKNSETTETTTTNAIETSTTNNETIEIESRQNNVTERVVETSTSDNNETVANLSITHKHDSIEETSALHHNEIDSKPTLLPITTTPESVTHYIDNLSTSAFGSEEGAAEVTYSSNDRRRRR